MYKTTKETYNFVLNRDKKCRLCGTTQTLQLHHIEGRSRLKTNDVNNCIMLCHKCHMWVHQHNTRQMVNLLKERAQVA